MRTRNFGPRSPGPHAGGQAEVPAGVAARVVAAQVLDAVLHEDRSLKAEFAKTLIRFDDPRDRALVEAIVFAALRRRSAYATALADWMPRPPGRRDGSLRALLYAGFAQLDALELPPHAAVAATVDAARALDRAHQAGLVNALLRRAIRDGLPAADPAVDWPSWLLQHIENDWPQHRDAILVASAQPAPLWLRVNARHCKRDDYLQRLEAAGIETTLPVDLPDAVRIEVSLPVLALPGFHDGDVSVQDGSAQRVADALSLPAGAHVLDACAAPGGKSAHLLERDPTLRLNALDVDARRVRRMRETFARLGVEADARAADAADPDTWWDGTPFDAILIDAPCSATGIVRRQPDILLHRRESDLTSLIATQARLLDALWPMLAPGGTLLYATCSILHAENGAQIKAFLARTPGACVVPLDARFGHGVPDETGSHGHQRLPGEDGMDGFFYSRLSKTD